MTVIHGKGMRWAHPDRMRFGGVVHPRTWKAAKRGDRKAMRAIIEDLRDLSMVGGFVGRIYAKAARRLKNIELCMR